MERLLVLRLEAVGCHAEAVFNGVPLARVGGEQTLLTLPVHEFTLAGGNEIELIINPAPPGVPAPAAVPTLQLSDGKLGASLRLLLPRVGSPAHPTSARTLAQLDWAPSADEVYTSPTSLRERVELPISFPRWRWLEAPVLAESLTPALKAELSAYLLEIALGLARGNLEPLIQAQRLRLEELALAYQRPLADDVNRLRSHLQQLHAIEPFKPVLPTSANLLLRPVAGGRLLECLGLDGGPLLHSPRAGGGRVAWPLRVAAVEGKFYVLR